MSETTDLSEGALQVLKSRAYTEAHNEMLRILREDYENCPVKDVQGMQILNLWIRVLKKHTEILEDFVFSGVIEQSRFRDELDSLRSEEG